MAQVNIIIHRLLPAILLQPNHKMGCKRFKIEWEVGDVKYCQKCQIDNLVKQATIPIGGIGHQSLHYFDDIYYSKEVI